MSTEKRLYQYALTSKKTIIIALILLSVSVAAALTGPFIAKTIIDEHISSIDEAWYQTESGSQAVSYYGTYYTRAGNLPESEQTGEPIYVQQNGLDFYVTSDSLPDGEKRYQDGTLQVSNADGTFEAQADALSADQVMAFYQPEIRPILMLLGLYLALILGSSFFQYGQRYLLQKSANRIIQRIRTDAFNHLSSLPVRFFDHLPAGKIVSRVTNDTEAIRELYMTVLANFFSSAIYIIGVYIALFLLDVRLGLITLVLLPILFIWMKLYRKFSVGYNRNIRSKVSEINAAMNENIQGMPIIQAFNREKQLNGEFEKLNKEHYGFQTKMLRLNSLTSHNLTGVLRNLVFVALIVVVMGSVGGGWASFLTLGIIYAFVDYVNRLFEPVNQIVNQLANLEQARVSGDRVFELMDKEGTSVDDSTMERPKGEVLFDNVSFAYKEDEYVLNHLSFKANPGETVALVGHTGSGKSSIMNLLFRFYDCQKGDILIDGVSTKDLSPQAIREHMGIVLQEPYLFTGTIASNIAMENPKVSREEIEKAVDLVGGTELFSYLPNGLDEEVQEKGNTLSSGQRQLISFARALVANPAILVLDEATSSIDTETEGLIQKGMESLKSGRTTFIIAHRLSTIQDADQILVLNRGEIVEQGNHDELMKQNGSYAQMYRLQKNEAS
ncbi:ABC transporter ATP-binding protein [Alkalicoccobacillus plakortidis]|uniref:ABC transporter ATP-binding protein/permease n=1 Tax=Alkalicoccobacillus plakortidis TaxID=444060 RepID=A0ABT0XM37_9BACI|nr:ABC transporter ATP-binding protein [Alkalicoccobacillus plakortidis]MCM2676959.1 ABC transporter ATP-binding protein/permease [Alkalicoccobacillus plakortidis]